MNSIIRSKILILDEDTIALNGLSDGIVTKENRKTIKLPKREPVMVGIDGSNNNTGIYIRTVSGKRIAIMAIEKDRSAKNYTYRKMLGLILEDLFRGLTIRLLVIEEPYGGEPLLALMAIVSMAKNNVKVFSNVPAKSVLAPVWRKGYMTSQDYSGRYVRYKVKDAVKEETLIRFPEMSRFLPYSTKDFDAYEAVGVLEGFLYLNYVDGDVNGKQKVSTAMPDYNHNWSSRVFKYNTKDKTSFKEGYMKTFDSKTNVDISSGIEHVIYNPSLSLEENCARVTGELSDIFVVMEIPKTTETLIQNWSVGEWVALDSDYAWGVITWRDKFRKRRGVESLWVE